MPEDFSPRHKGTKGHKGASKLRLADISKQGEGVGVLRLTVYCKLLLWINFRYGVPAGKLI